ncbi:MAG TPA: DUF3347 domain-containing protein [Puia sp.]|nr:DUF3347 domain-containing protein [Puia sp.]
MKKLLLIVLVLALAAFVAWQFFPRKEEKTVEEKKDEPLAIAKNSTAFDQSFSKLMSDYYLLHDALVDWDTVKANAAAKSLEQKSDSLPFSELKGDSNIILTAKNFALSISSEMKGFIGEDSIEQKRRSFNMLTDEMYNIIRTVRYGGQTIYHMRCPMAFGDSAEAYWLTNVNKIVNPYLGNKHPTYQAKMLGCGEMVDSLDFTKK